jgi:ParB family chromosome partitioning protein
VKKKGLGKGLQALLTDIEPNESDQIVQIDVTDLQANQFQPRRTFDQEKLNELADSIKENGVIQPIIVRRFNLGYEIVAGERRWRAARIAGLKEVPAIIREIDDLGMMEIALIENIQRQDLNPMEEAQAYAKLLEAMDITQEELARRVGKSRSLVANTLRLLNLPPDVQEMVARKEITFGHAKVILSAGSPKEQSEAAEAVYAEDLSVRQLEEMLKKAKERNTVPRGTKAKTGPSGQIAFIEDELRQELGTLVKIRQGKKKGSITIEYYGDEELERLLRLLRKVAETKTTDATAKIII